jgi:hydroxypyruvate reductase
MRIEISSKVLGKNGEVIERMLQSALDAVDPEKCVQRDLAISDKDIQLLETGIARSTLTDIFVVGIGKAVLPMAIGINKVLGDVVSGGYLIGKAIDPGLTERLPEKYQIVCGDHPVPSISSVRAAEGLVEFLAKTRLHDLVICLLSGGGSALCTLPYEEIGLEGMQSTTSLLLRCGATIHEINTIRKHLDRVKGGGLLEFIHPSQSITLILSDVVGNQISMIASGPTAADPTTFSDAERIFKKYEINQKLPSSVRKFIEDGVKGNHSETVKMGASIIKKNKNVIIGSLNNAIHAASIVANESGFCTRILTMGLTGESRDQGAKLARQLRDHIRKNQNRRRPVCFIAGGETTVTLHGKGKGGRNQEFALAAAIELTGTENCAVITFATDGEDGPTDAAGAIITGSTVIKGIRKGLDAQEFLNNNDSYRYFEAMDLLIKSGPTGTNVNDLVLLFAF